MLLHLTLPIIPLGIGYFVDFKKRENHFLSKIKGTFGWIPILLTSLAISTLSEVVYDNIFPLNKDFGITHNETREELGIPIIEDNWVEEPSMGNQFRQWYIPTVKDSTCIHRKKKIEFDNWRAISEEDYFESSADSVKLMTRYDYQSNEMIYLFIEPIPLHEQLFFDDEGRFIRQRQEEIEIALTKPQFTQVLEGLNHTR